MKNIVIFLLLIATLGFGFYWYGWRPTKIKERCSADARFDSRAILESDDKERQEFIDSYYKDCLTRFGLN